jgi:molybdate transport system substrate-binding protein
VKALLIAAAALLSPLAAAAQVTVLSAGAVEPGVRAAAASFQKATGQSVNLTFATAPQIRARIAAGESFDVVIAPPGALEEFAKAGRLGSERVIVGRVGIGVAVRPGAPVPDISNADALRKSVLDAESLVFNRASTGLYFETLLKKMAIYDQVAAKTTRYPDGASVLEHLLKGSGREVGFGAITEILLYRDKGLRLVGPLPAAVQNYTRYGAGRMASASNAAGAASFLQYLGSEPGRNLFVAAGIERDE